MKKWILVTASFGKDEFHDSASRLISQARTFRIFDEIIHVNERNIQQYAPYFSQRCDEYSLNSTKGFGFYSWKPEIVDSISRLFPLHGIAYIDAGCEMNNNSFTRFRLKKMLKSTKNGGFFH